MLHVALIVLFFFLLMEAEIPDMWGIFNNLPRQISTPEFRTCPRKSGPMATLVSLIYESLAKPNFINILCTLQNRAVYHYSNRGIYSWSPFLICNDWLLKRLVFVNNTKNILLTPSTIEDSNIIIQQ